MKECGAGTQRGYPLYPQSLRPTFLLLGSGAAFSLFVPPCPSHRLNLYLRPIASQEGQRAMDILGWLWWVLISVLGFLWWLLGLLWSVVWFLISGWVSTLLQIAILVAIIFFLKYGWQRAPAELWRRGSTFARFSWKWLSARESDAGAAPREVLRDRVRIVRVKEFGDVNVSTLMSLAMLAGLAVLATLQ
jgi:hypothetical protein